MKLDELTSRPTLTVAIAGNPYRFGRITLGIAADLQAWLRENIPSPTQLLKGQLDGLDAEDRRYLLDKARADLAQWPPDPETRSGVARLLAGDAGQAACFRAALSVHQPELSATAADHLFKVLTREVEAAVKVHARALREADRRGDRKAQARAKAALEEARDAAEKQITRIFAVAFNFDLGDDGSDDGEDSPAPKAE